MTLEGDRPKERARVDMAGAVYINDILYDADADGYLFCGENGLGFLGADGEARDLQVYGFDSSVSDVMIDYQGNLWFVSNKQGVMKRARTPFVDLFLRAGLSDVVVNAVASARRSSCLTAASWRRAIWALA